MKPTEVSVRLSIILSVASGLDNVRLVIAGHIEIQVLEVIIDV